MTEQADYTARREISELRALVEDEGRATRAAVEAVMAYLREHEREQREHAKHVRLALEDLDSAAARLASQQTRTDRHLAANDRRDAEIATSVARIATTGGATGGAVGAVIMAILSALQGCDRPSIAPQPGGQHGAPSAYRGAPQ
jgi:hypothetical protein